VIEIDEHHRDRRRVAAGTRQLARQELSQIPAVVQPGERFRDRLLLESFLTLLQAPAMSSNAAQLASSSRP